ncbi:Endonuclease III-like protein 1 [Perkinsus olseni]|uniref:Endonuclease III-like protein 1 n=1 Tax=Perkinsus olseni TaxID=32597 RepID=A0A7J6L269_PEROL|nr:Endonuclease III-like protein 1 [Perkinsus olseni]KAF4653244.1 Endonuclease III-like protein 1 [Perkinsus olseni]
MGCHMLTDSEAEPEDRRFQLLVAVMLSSQTKDQENAKAMHNLHVYFKGKGGLTRKNLAAMEEKELDAQIKGVGFHNTKTRNLIRVANLLEDRFHGKVPDTMEGLLSLPGVGPKMAVLVMEVGHGRRDAGICVDTHVHRIAAMLGWTKDAKTPEATRQQLEARLPVEVWPDVNLLLVGLGQMIQQRPFDLLRRCIKCTDPVAAFRLVGRIGGNLKVIDKATGDSILDVAEAAKCDEELSDYLKGRGVKEGHHNSSPAKATPSKRKRGERGGSARTRKGARNGPADSPSGFDEFTYSGE